MRHGVFITFEGPEGSGKSTQIILAKNSILDFLCSKFTHRDLGKFSDTVLREYFSSKIVSFREPGGAPQAEDIRKLVLSQALTPKEQCDYFLEGRKINVKEIIGPGLEKGVIVLCDRFDLSTYVYQSRKNKEGDYLSSSDIQAKHIPVFRAYDPINPAFPDATVIIMVDPIKGLECEQEKNVFSSKGLEFHTHVANSMSDTHYVQSVLGKKRHVIFIDRRGDLFDRDKEDVSRDITTSLSSILTAYYTRNEKTFLSELDKIIHPEKDASLEREV